MSFAVEEHNIIHGRPDLDYYSGRRAERFGVTRAKKHPPYVFSIGGNACLIHKIAYVELHWWEAKYDHMVKRHRPKMIANTICGMFKFLDADRSRTCLIPSPDAVLCGRCHGEMPTFGKNGAGTKAGMKRTEAHVKLGCVVKGY